MQLKKLDTSLSVEVMLLLLPEIDLIDERSFVCEKRRRRREIVEKVGRNFENR